MHSPGEIVGELEQVRSLLINPHHAALDECDRRLNQVIDSIRRNPEQSLAPDIKSLVQMIRFLLDKAGDFWHARQSGIKSNHYSFNGAAVPVQLVSTFSVEV